MPLPIAQTQKVKRRAKENTMNLFMNVFLNVVYLHIYYNLYMEVMQVPRNQFGELDLSYSVHDDFNRMHTIVGQFGPSF